MARGWESKSVEMQIEDRERADAPPGNFSADAGLRRELELLELTRKRLLHEIENTHNRALQEMKKRALSFVESRMNEFRASARQNAAR